MAYLFYLIVFVVCVLVLLLGSYIFYRLNEFYKIPHNSFKHSLFLVFGSSIASVVAALVSVFLFTPFIAEVVLAVVTIGAVLWFYRKFFNTGWKKAIRIWITAQVIIWVIGILFILPIRMFVVEPFLVNGQSMAPTYKSDDYLFVEKFDKNLQKGDVIIAKIAVGTSTSTIIRRVGGVPGETIDGRVLDSKEYLLVSDGGSQSFVGPTRLSEVVGKVWINFGPVYK